MDSSAALGQGLGWKKCRLWDKSAQLLRPTTKHGILTFLNNYHINKSNHCSRFCDYTQLLISKNIFHLEANPVEGWSQKEEKERWKKDLTKPEKLKDIGHFPNPKTPKFDFWHAPAKIL